MGIVKFLFIGILGLIVLGGLGQVNKDPINALMCWVFVLTVHAVLWPTIDAEHQAEKTRAAERKAKKESK
jgi:hypothetical protein